jgi:hypothetical protein
MATTHNTNMRQTSIPPGGIRTRNPRKQAAVDPCLRSRGLLGGGLEVQQKKSENRIVLPVACIRSNKIKYPLLIFSVYRPKFIRIRSVDGAFMHRLPCREVVAIVRILRV